MTVEKKVRISELQGKVVPNSPRTSFSTRFALRKERKGGKYREEGTQPNSGSFPLTHR
jgi:hypothetical protein